MIRSFQKWHFLQLNENYDDVVIYVNRIHIT